MKKTILLLFAFIALVQFSFAQETKFQLSSHILDITSGKPATGVKITLSKKDKNDVITEVFKYGIIILILIKKNNIQTI